MSTFLTHYLLRLNWSRPVAADIATLRALHLQHNCTLPFENLDVLLPREIHLDRQSLFDKLVKAGRGGYCFEQNGLFERALREIGFTVRSEIARVVLANQPAKSPRTHRFLLVTLASEQWIADVGFGGKTLTGPIQLVADREQHTPHGVYRLIAGDNNWTLQYWQRNDWESLYEFDLSEAYDSDYLMANFWTSHWPESHFRHHLLICRHLSDGGKLTLMNFKFTHWAKGSIVGQYDVQDTQSLYQLLKERFNLRLDDEKYGFSLQEFSALMTRLDTGSNLS
ncbi:N-hydroxyarylamine O-acetyltransferase [Erwinia typographi]|uniref:N-hydroxyarylamine O-acetyltransferase n=1 Tax=Erwinia typographi TaxID=371042 RepID=A0A0A3YKP3_9GAMM|nr:arylamine N-acetyltransferase [Erwinia typographi]KGT86039.1 N-hydroxyarylamine O-acetyltransferase [Erwinia typographi]